jgi:hypothetical protein
MMNAPCGPATLRTQTPNYFFEMNPKIFRLSPHQGEEHLDPHCIRQPFTFEREGREELPFDQGQGVDLGVHSFRLVFAFRPVDDGPASAQTTAERHEFADANDNVFVLEFAGKLVLLAAKADVTGSTS